MQRIFGMFLTGMTPHGIAQQLTAEGIPSPAKKPKWNACTVARMLANEKYKGEALLQKTFTVDFLTKKKKVNERRDPAILRHRCPRSHHRASCFRYDAA